MSVARALLQISLLLGATALVTAGTAQPPGPTPVTYHMPIDGELTLGLFDKDGSLLRWIVQDDFRHAGDHTESWDGLDQWLRQIPAGSYTVRGIYHAALATDYQMTVLNPGQPPWPTGDGKGDWLSDEGNPQAVVTDGTNVFLGAPDSEKGFTTMGLDAAGHRLWGTNQPRHQYTRCVSLTLDGDYLYALYSGPERPDPDASPYAGKDAVGRAVLMCYNKMTGERALFSTTHDRLRVVEWPYTEQPAWLWNLRNAKSFSPAVYAGQPRYSCLDVGEPTNAMGLAAAGGHLYVSLLEENKVIELDPETGQATGRTIAVPSPVGLCRIDDHTLLAVSGTNVVRVNLTDDSVTPVVSSGLVAPVDVTVDKAADIYVSDWGASFQVKVFDDSGKFLRAIGKEGGRPWVGPWDATGMLLPRGVAVTDAGQVWVAEDDGTPPRWSVWDSESGELLKDYLGPAPYGGGTLFWMDPHDATQLHAMGARFKLDFDGKTATPEAIDYRRQSADDPFTPNGRDLGPHPQVRILYHDGHEYAVMDAGYLSIMQRQKDDTYRPVAALGQVREEGSGGLKNDGTGQVVWDSDVGYHLYAGYYPDFFRGHAGDSYSWTDLNGDMLVQPEEMHWVPETKADFAARAGGLGRWAAGWGVDLAPDWSFFFAARFHDRIGVFRLPVKGWTPAGAPLYDIAEAQPIFFEAPEHSIYSLHVTNDNKLIVSYDFEDKRNTDAVAAYSLDGKKLWSVAMPHPLEGKGLHANGAIYDFNVPALGDVVCAWLYHGSFRPHLFTSDGLYVGTFFNETMMQKVMHNSGVSIGTYVGTPLDDAAVGPDALWSESAKYFYQAPDGSLEVVNGGNQQEHLFRIRGLEADKTGRFKSDYTLTR